MKYLKRISALLLAVIILALLLPNATVFAAGTDMRYGRTVLGKMTNGSNLQTIYDKLVTACSGNSPVAVDIDKNLNITHKQLVTTYQMFYRDYPEYFWIVNGGWGSSCIPDSDNNIENNIMLSIVPAYIEEIKNLAAAKTAYNQKVNELISGLNGKSDYEKSKVLHDKLIDTVTYEITDKDQTSYGALVEGKAVCNGYTRAYQHLLQEVGIASWYVSGSRKSPGSATSEPHAWNLVKIDGSWYYTDVTWDDQIDKTFYSYFNITTKQLKAEHTIGDYEQYLPNATATAANFYIKENRVFDSYNQTELVNLLKKDNNKTQIYTTGNPYSFMSSIEIYKIALASALGAEGSFSISIPYSVLGNGIMLNVIITGQDHVCSPKATVPQVNATCLTNGKKAYYTCDCGLKFLDSACTQQINNDNELEITTISHTPSGWKNDASSHWKECTKCGTESLNTRSSHNDNNKDNKCDTCGYALPVADSNGNIVISGGPTSDNSNNQTPSKKPNNNNSITSSTDNNSLKESKKESEIEIISPEENITSFENIIVDTDETTSTYKESYLYCGARPDGIALKWILICGGVAIVVAAGIAVAVVLITKKKA